MRDELHLSIITVEGAVIDRMVGYVRLPVEDGSLGVLTGHAPMLCAIKKGMVKFSYGAGQGHFISVGDGIANINNNQVTLLVSSAGEESENDNADKAPGL